jgi:hypothetical protein
MPFFRTHYLSIATLALALLAASKVQAQSDNFDDNLIGSQWTLLQDSPGELSLTETGGRVQVTANSPSSPNFDALYLSNGADGFRMATDTDFVIRLDYNFGSFDTTGVSVGDTLGLAFGVGRDLDGTDSAAIGFAVSRQLLGGFPITGTGLGEAHRTNDVQTENLLSIGGPTSGTFEISYNSFGDDLTLGVGTDTFVLQDTVRGTWGANDLLVSFGARGNGFSLFAGETFLDNFQVVSGRVVSVPEPAGAMWVVVAGYLLRRRRSNLA